MLLLLSNILTLLEQNWLLEGQGMLVATSWRWSYWGAIPVKIDFNPSDDYIYMMDELRKTILKTPEDVADLKAEIDIAALLEQESNLVELY